MVCALRITSAVSTWIKRIKPLFSKWGTASCRGRSLRGDTIKSASRARIPDSKPVIEKRKMRQRRKCLNGNRTLLNKGAAGTGDSAEGIDAGFTTRVTGSRHLIYRCYRAECRLGLPKELVKAACAEGERFDCAPWGAQGQRAGQGGIQARSGPFPGGQRERAMEASLFQGYKSRLPVIECTLETAGLILGPTSRADTAWG